MTFEEFMDFTADIPSNFMDHTYEMVYKWVPQIHGRLVEFGTGLGKITVAMNLINPDLEIFTNDIGERYGSHQEYFDRIMNTFESHNVNHSVYFEIGSSLEMPLLDELDGLFIDSEHTYEVTKAEIKRWVPMVKKGGIILFDDYDLSNHNVREDMHGVNQAVKELILSKPDEFEVLDLGVCAVFRKLI